METSLKSPATIRFWIRRASAAVLIAAILHNDYNGISPFKISDALICDGHELVLNLIDRRTVMTRVAFRYALGKYCFRNAGDSKGISWRSKY